ncbi:MAG: amidase, partial [Candidatus Rokubacteria bacterium]|nr:amidase [Candidatus Rokubacteria bacterium]
AVSGAVRPPRLGLVRQFFLERAGPEVGAHVEAVAQRLARAGASLDEVKLPGSFAGIHEAGMRVMRVEAAAYHAARFAAHAADYPPQIRGVIEAGLQVGGVDYVAAQHDRWRFRVELAPLFAQLDALMVPVAETAAPRGFGSTGDPVFCAPWTFAGLPAISLPSGLTREGLPLAVQLVSGVFEEARLLATARWCEAVLGFSSAPPEAQFTDAGPES